MGLHLLFTQRWWRPVTFPNLLFLLNSISVVPFLPPSSLPVEPHCELARPKLQSHRCSVSDPTQLQSPRNLALTHVCFSISLPSALSWFSSPTGDLVSSPPISTSPSCSPEKSSIFYKFIHRYLLWLVHLPCPHHLIPVPRTLGGAR